jgi:hypothetical protein
MNNMGCWNTGLDSFQKWNIGNVVRSILLSDEDINEQVGENIFPIVAPEDTEDDFIVYRRMQYTKKAVKHGVYEDICEIAVIAVSENYDDSIVLAEKIDNTLSGQHKLSNGYRLDIVLSDSTEIFEDNKFLQTLIFTIK